MPGPSQVSTNNGNGVSNMPCAWGASFTPAVGDLLLAVGAVASSTSATPGTMATPSGYTLLITIIANNGTVSTRMNVYGRWADGSASDAAPTITYSGSVATSMWYTRVMRGLDSTAALPLQPAAGGSGGAAYTGTTGPVNGNTIVTSLPDLWIFSVYAERGPSGQTWTWAGGATLIISPTKNGFQYTSFADQTVATSGTSVTHSVTHSSGGGAAAAVASVAFAMPDSGAGGGGGSATAAAEMMAA